MSLQENCLIMRYAVRPDSDPVYHCDREEQMTSSQSGNTLGRSSDHSIINGTLSKGTMKKRRMKQSNSKLNFGDATDDVHVCIMCLRAIMNHQVHVQHSLNE